MNLRGAKPVNDNKIKEYILALDVLQDLYDENIADRFKNNFVKWLDSSKKNNLKGLKEFSNIKLCNGTVQSFDHFYFRHSDRFFRFYSGEFMYHQACLKNNGQFQYLDEGKLAAGDALILSVPFSDIGKQHAHTESLLMHAEDLKIPVLLDFAYYPCTKNIDIDLMKYKCIETITFSISKAFYGAEFLRVGLRLERNDIDDGIDVFNSVDMHNRISLSIANKLIAKYPVDWNWDQYSDVYREVCKEKNLEETDCIMFGLGGKEYKDFNRGGTVNRVCISELIGEKINGNSSKQS